MLRSEKCEKFLKENEVNCCTMIDPEDEGDFNRNGCDCCDSLACTTYDCHGYSPENNDITILGGVCHQCLCYFANGDEELEND